MNPKIAQTVYAIGTIIPAILSIGLIWGGLDQGVADGVNQLTAGVVALLCGVAPATATVRVAKQRKDGTFDVLAPVDQVVTGVQAVLNAQTQAISDVEKVKQAISDAVSIAPAAIATIPALGPLAQQVINMAYQRPVNE